MSSTTTPKGDGGVATAALVSSFILSQLSSHRAAHSNPVPPLFIGVQGPQGCGKSHLTSMLPPLLEAHNLRVASLSLDDLYLPHARLAGLASSNTTNALLQGRGQPGTHDLALGVACLSALRAGEAVDLPVFEKSMFGGEGDRSAQVVRVEGRVDVVIFEGWMTGFGALGEGEVRRRYEVVEEDPGKAGRGLGYEIPFFLAHSVEDLIWVDRALEEYGELWGRLDCFVQLKPEKMNYVWEWRLEQEHNMKAKNGGVGMTDDQVIAFIARYMPGYELFLEGVQSPEASWKGKGLKLVVGRGREIVGTEEF